MMQTATRGYLGWLYLYCYNALANKSASLQRRVE